MEHDSPESQKNSYQAQLLFNRLVKRVKVLRKWARRRRLTCYRLYDRDIPEIPLLAEAYGFLPGHVDSVLEAARLDLAAPDSAEFHLVLCLYERPYEKPEAEEEAWLGCMADAASRALGIGRENIVIKTRKRQRGDSQYEKQDSARTICGVVLEQGQLFRVNLSGYLDTGLFLDHRELRAAVREISGGKSVLNLFSYTGAFSVYAAQGGASLVESVDLSNTYLGWARQNMELNGFSDRKKYRFTRADVAEFLAQKNSQGGTERYGIIILDPPTFSNSKSSRSTLDINRDWPKLVASCLALLADDGILFFSTNSRRLKFDSALLPVQSRGRRVIAEDITGSTASEDFRNARIHRCWKIRFGGEG